MTGTRAQEYKIEAAVIYSERLKRGYDVRTYVMELSLFEDIQLPYLTGQVVMMDDMGAFDEMALRGTETIYLKISGVEEGYRPEVMLTMNITSIVKRVKTAERTEVYQLSLISPIAYRDSAVKVSRSYVGKLDDIAASIVKNYLGVEVSYDYLGRSTGQAAVKVIPPYITPLESAKWLLDRATTIDGVPFCCWQSIYEQIPEETIRFGNLDTMMKPDAGPWNKNKPLIYSQSGAQSVALKKTLDQSFVLKDFVSRNTATNLERMCDAAIGSQLSTLDTYTSQNFRRHFGVTKYLEDVKTEIMYSDQNVHDDVMTITVRGETKKLDEFNHRHIDMITSYGTYGTWNSYHDDPRQLDAMNKVRSNAIRSLLRKNTYEIVAAGSAFFAPMAGGGKVGVGAGDVTRIDVLTADTSEDEPQYDENRSGDYMIGKCRHVFKDTTHTVSASVTKLDKGKQS
jgi:hypothetical protein